MIYQVTKYPQFSNVCIRKKYHYLFLKGLTAGDGVKESRCCRCWGQLKIAREGGKYFCGTLIKLNCDVCVCVCVRVCVCVCVYGASARGDARKWTGKGGDPRNRTHAEMVALPARWARSVAAALGRVRWRGAAPLHAYY